MCGFISESRLKIFTFKIKLFDSVVGVKIIIFNLSKVGILHCEIMNRATNSIPSKVEENKAKTLFFGANYFFILKYHLPLF